MSDFIAHALPIVIVAVWWVYFSGKEDERIEKLENIGRNYE